MPRRIPIRIKLAAALAVPICALLLVSVLEVRQGSIEQDETRSQTELATASIGPGGIITSLQNERNFGSVWLLGFEATLQLPVKTFDEASAATDEAIATFREDLEDKSADVQETFEPVLADIEDQLAPMREVVTTYTGERNLDTQPISDPFFNDYTALIDQLFAANGQSALSIDDPTLRRGVELTDLATHQIEYVARLTRVLLIAGVSDGLNDPPEIAEAAGLLGQIDNGVQLVDQLGTGRYRAPAEKVSEEFAASGYTELAREAIDTGQVRVTETMASLSREDDEGYNGFRTTVNDEINQQADRLNDQVTANRLRYILLGVLALAVAGLVTWLVSRSITRPLRSLTQQAKQMAETRLPAAVTDILETPLGDDVTVPTVDPIRVTTRDEVSDVADALNTVQDSALDLAVEQAVLRRNIADSFVNLGRRNQNLLGRQLDFITELETNETNADTLANLFRLDHLATRMRRNAESLLVLAGIEPPRQWAAPVRLTDVIRAALGEVEDYQRVTVRGVEPATIIGSAAADLAHLLAELIENALVFSPPDQSVDIRGRTNPGGYTLAIIDSGLGMPAGDVAAANRRLAGTESFTIAPSKYLGHYVAGNLAARHDIHVRLDTSRGHGVTATLTLPT
ncbi:MAG TPA: nitrate- and nitrite sensing domain-containing protein, partial [Acidimicrobiales bacterium]|nr:nitrate- and nitrite sensing domain-containing protein [Acidimicrobiales bacterium]